MVDSSSTVLSSEDNDIIIHININKSLQEIIDNLDNGMDDYDVGKTYEIFNDDYNIKISPLNRNIFKNNSTYNYFSNCENILRLVNHLNDSSILTMYQIKIYDSNKYALIVNFEYAIFNEDKERLNLSVCNEGIIKNDTKSVDEVISNIKNEIINSDLLLNITNGNIKNVIKQDSRFIYSISPLHNQEDNRFNLSIVDIGDCEDILKEKYNLSHNDPLIIFKISYFLEGLLFPINEYEIYSNKVKEELNMD